MHARHCDAGRGIRYRPSVVRLRLYFIRFCIRFGFGLCSGNCKMEFLLFIVQITGFPDRSVRITS